MVVTKMITRKVNICIVLISLMMVYSGMTTFAAEETPTVEDELTTETIKEDDLYEDEIRPEIMEEELPAYLYIGDYQHGGEWKVVTDGCTLDTFASPTGYTLPAYYTTQQYSNDDATYSCAALVKRYYLEALGVEVYNLNGTTSTPSVLSGGGTFIETRQPVPGDIIRSNLEAHWMIVKSVSGNEAAVIQQNAKWNDEGVHKGAIGFKTYLNDANVSYFHWTGSGSGSESATIYSALNATNVGQATAKIEASLIQSFFDISECGYYIGTSEGNMTKGSVVDRPSGIEVQSISYNLSGLNPATTYYYEVYAVRNGKTYWTGKKTFTTNDISSGGDCKCKRWGEGEAWLRSDNIFGKHVEGGECVDLIKKYSEFLIGNADWMNNGGNASAYTDTNHMIPEGWKYVNASDGYQSGDIFVSVVNYGNGQKIPWYTTSLGHIGVIVSNHGDGKYSIIHQVGQHQEGIMNGTVQSADTYPQEAIACAIRPNYCKPIVTAARLKNIDMISGTYTIEAKINSQHGISKVEFPTWTEQEGQDDLAWPAGELIEQNGNNYVFEYTVKFSDHNNETGTYNTHIYAFDSYNVISDCFALDPIVITDRNEYLFVLTGDKANFMKDEHVGAVVIDKEEKTYYITSKIKVVGGILDVFFDSISEAFNQLKQILVTDGLVNIGVKRTPVSSGGGRHDDIVLYKACNGTAADEDVDDYAYEELSCSGSGTINVCENTTVSSENLECKENGRIIINGDSVIKVEGLSCNGSGTINVKENCVVNIDTLDMTGGTINIGENSILNVRNINMSNGHIKLLDSSSRLIVSENVNQTGGQISVGKGIVEFKGDYTCKDGILNMQDSEGLVQVYGDFNWSGWAYLYKSGSYSSTTDWYWEAGTIELYKDVKIGSAYSYSYTAQSLMMKDDFVIKLNGEGTQKVSSEQSFRLDSSYDHSFGTLVINNPNIIFENGFATHILKSDRAQIVLNKDVTADVFVDKNIDQDLVFNKNVKSISAATNKKIIIKGNLNPDNASGDNMSITLATGESSLTIEGLFNQKDGLVRVGKGKLVCKGDYTCKDGILNMQDAEGLVQVYGDFNWSGWSYLYKNGSFSSTTDWYWEAGTIELYKDVKIGSAYSYSYTVQSLKMKDDFVIKLNGEGTQRVSSEERYCLDASSSYDHSFGTLVVNNPNVIFEKGIAATTLASDEDNIDILSSGSADFYVKNCAFKRVTIRGLTGNSVAAPSGYNKIITTNGDDPTKYDVSFEKIDESKFEVPTIVEASLTLNGSIGVNLFAKDIGACDHVLINGVVYEKPEPEKDGSYKYTYTVPAKKIDDDIVIKFCDEYGQPLEMDNGEKQFTYHVSDYIDEVLINSNKYSDSLVKLCVALNNYCRSAKNYFTYGDYKLISVDDTAIVGFDESVSGELNNGIRYVGSSLLLKDTITIRHYFSGDLSSCCVSLNGKAMDINKKSGLSYVDIKNINAVDLGSAFAICISEGNTEYELSYSVLSYCQKMLKRGDISEANLAKSIYWYKMAAETYFANSR